MFGTNNWLYHWAEHQNIVTLMIFLAVVIMGTRVVCLWIGNLYFNGGGRKRLIRILGLTDAEVQDVNDFEARRGRYSKVPR